MRKVVLFLVVGCLVVAASWLVASIPGHVQASIGAWHVATSTPVAILALVALFFLLSLVLRLLRWIISLPALGGRWRRGHRLHLGQRAITRVLVALAAGEQAAARKEARRARTLLGDTPQTLLLVAEAGRLSGNEDEATEAFQALTKQEEGQFLGFRGLLRQAVERRDWQVALEMAKQAEAAHPGTAWLRQQRVELALQTSDWAEALKLSGSGAQRATYALAAAEAETDPKQALSLAKQAWKLDPAFPPAVLAYATRLRARGREKKVLALVTQAWTQAPHPDLAAFVLATAGDHLGRAQAGRRLAALRPADPESRLLLARVLLEAGVTGEARHQLELARQEGVAQRRLFLLLAEIEEQARGDTEAGRLAYREALRQAATAEADPRWTCSACHTTHSAWHPKCPACGAVGTVAWTSGARALPMVIPPSTSSNQDQVPAARDVPQSTAA